jgi:hypothetical protein
MHISSDAQFWVIMTWLSMLAAMIEKSWFRFVFMGLLLACALMGAFNL